MSCLLRRYFSRLFGALLACAVPISAAADQMIPVNVILNTEIKGSIFAIQTNKRDLLIAADDLAELGITHQGASINIDNRSFVSLNSLSASLKFILDEKTSSLVLTVDPRLLQKTIVDYATSSSIESNNFRIDSAFVNYSVSRREVIDQDISNLDLPLEGVVAAHGVIVRTQVTYHQIPNDQYWARGLTNVIKDRPQDMQRITLGDFVASSGEFGGSGIFSGISVSKNFTLTPYFNKYPGMSFGGMLDTPSKVEVFVNDTLVRSEAIPAGTFELNNLPNIYGSGVARLVITDAFGRQREEAVSYYVGSRLLKPGLHEYSYNLGVTRDSLESFQPQYGSSLALLGFHRRGINTNLTTGLQYEYLQDRFSIRPELTFLAGKIGEIELGGGLSQASRQDDGRIGFVRHSYTSRFFHSLLSYHASTNSYRTISSTENSNPVVQYFSASTGIHGTALGSFGVSYVNQLRLSSAQSEIYSINYSLRLPKQLSLFARASRTRADGGSTDAVFISLSSILGRSSSANLAYTQDGDRATRSAYVQHSVPHGTGLGFRARVSGDETVSTMDNVRNDLSVFYNAKHGVTSGNYYSDPAGQAYMASYSGSLAYIGGGFFLTRPITDSYGLVKVGQLDDVRVYYSNELIGETRNGQILLPNLASYSPNVIAIEPQDVPAEMSLTRTRQSVMPSYRNGSIVDFPVSVFQGFTGAVQLSVKGMHMVADYGDLLLQNTNQTYRSPIGRKGEFYFENLPAGKYRASIIVEKWTCQTTVTIPSIDTTLVNLGEVRCEM